MKIEELLSFSEAVLFLNSGLSDSYNLNYNLKTGAVIIFNLFLTFF